jgi:hypothetical protein
MILLVLPSLRRYFYSLVVDYLFFFFYYMIYLQCLHDLLAILYFTITFFNFILHLSNSFTHITCFIYFIFSGNFIYFFFWMIFSSWKKKKTTTKYLTTKQYCFFDSFWLSPIDRNIHCTNLWVLHVIYQQLQTIQLDKVLALLIFYFF